MMKRIVMILMLIAVLANPLFANSEVVATLYHAAKDSTSVYYGQDAFRNAVENCEDGDVITLSSGIFNSCNFFKKAITLRGAGMWKDEQNHVSPTIIDGVIWIRSDSIVEQGKGLLVEGIRFQGSIIYDPGLHRAQFVKCQFDEGIHDYDGNGVDFLSDVSFTNCVIKSDCSVRGDAIFINCHIENLADKSDVSNADISDPFEKLSFENVSRFDNCVISQYAKNQYFSEMGDIRFRNCILRNTYSYSVDAVGSTCMVNNCIGYLLSFDNILIGDYNKRFDNLADIFKSGNGSSVSYVLQDTIITNYPGSDGTQVGIYGGPMPFNANIKQPYVSKFVVASKSDESGKLKVEMQVSTPQ